MKKKYRLGYYSHKKNIKKKRRKLFLFIAFCLAAFLTGLFVSVKNYINMTYYIEGKIMPREETVTVEGKLSGHKYISRAGGRTSTAEKRYIIYFEDGREYNLYATECFDMEGFEELPLGSNIVLLLDDYRGYKMKFNGGNEIAEVRCGGMFYLKYEDYVGQRLRNKAFYEKSRWPISIFLFLLMGVAPEVFVIVIYKKMETNY